MEECILVIVNSIPDDDKCVIVEDITRLQPIISVKIINNYLLYLISLPVSVMLV